ncbi:MAG: rane protein-like protein [Solirubrobacterales bacterium]|nr:rane protein-like protein [Solirubrobacterales bacterium]
MSVTSQATTAPGRRRAAARPWWWPLAALTLLAAALRLSTLGLQSFWFDEAFTPVHVLHSSLSATLRAVGRTENSPPLWYLLEWVDWRVLGDGEVALRLPSALAGIATVPVAWMIGRELAGRRAAILAAALVAVNPLLVWYSQEARVYGLFVLMAALAMLCFLRAEREPTRGNLAAFAATASLALLTHYFAVFLLIGMALWLVLAPGPARARRRPVLAALAVPAIVGLALLPLIAKQGGHGTQWIGRWPFSQRLAAIPQYYLTGYSGAPLGHGVELLVALVIGGGVAFGLWRIAGAPAADSERAASADGGTGEPGPRGLERGAAIALLIAAAGILIPIALVAFGADYLAPRNLVAAMIPVTALIALLVVPAAAGRIGVAFGATIALAFLAISVDVDLSPRLQRGNWRGVANVLAGGRVDRAITTVQLGGAPLQYYMPGLHSLARGATVTVSEIDETGYAPLRASAGRPPAPGFRLSEQRNVDGLIVYRFVSSVPRAVSEATLRRHVITVAHPEVLVPAGLQASHLGA